MPMPFPQSLEEAQGNAAHYLKTLQAVAKEICDIQIDDLTHAERRIAKTLKNQGIVEEINQEYKLR